MSKLSFVVLLILGMLGVAVVNAQESDAGIAITLERTACRGTCPIYQIVIFEDGTIRYMGEDFVAVTGVQTAKIEPIVVEQMVDAATSLGYFDWDEAYTNQTVTDLPTVVTSVTRDGKAHRIERYAGDFSAPLGLSFLENWIDDMTSTHLWTGVMPDPDALSNGTDTGAIVLQRYPCFGACPVYSIVIFENGTVVYTGTANVEKIGVSIFEIDSTTLSSIVQQAQAIGYFEWQDSYEERVRTDQATVVTSIRWKDQFKQVSRYNGDPNAPLGLVWIEELIDQVVDELIERA